jgi:hypothetical protein
VTIFNTYQFSPVSVTQAIYLMTCMMAIGLAALLIILAKVIEIQNFLKKGSMKL